MFAGIHKVICRLPTKRLQLLSNINSTSTMSASPNGSQGQGDLSNQNADRVTTHRLPRKEKRAKRRAERKQAEKKRIAEKRAQARVASYVNKSDVVSSDDLELTSYYAENGLRKVYPYTFKFASHAKGRWQGRCIADVFCDEFRVTKPTLVKLLESGKIQVNQSIVNEDYVVKGTDYVTNTVHRHERPVTADPIEIIEDTEELLVVNKPASIPVHPCGKHRFNSLTYILAKQHGYRNVRCTYRLDRMTSGVMIFSKVQGRAFEIVQAIKNRETEKTYVCRVEGEFPEGEVECREPMKTLCEKIGLQFVSPDGKDAYTTFERLSYNGTSSVVQCRPHTGRTHQIRVHLQFLGFPIVNDGLYNNEAWGPQKGKNGEFGKSNQQLVEDIYKAHEAEVKFKNSGPLAENDKCVDKPETSDKDSSPLEQSSANSSELNDISESDRVDTGSSEACSNETKRTESTKSENNANIDEQPNKRLKTDSDEQTVAVNNAASSDFSSNCSVNKSGLKTCVLPSFDASKLSYDEDCEECQKVYTEPKPSDLVMYLHALKNKGPTWDYSTELPDWAKEDFTEKL